MGWWIMGSDHIQPLPDYVPKVDMVNHPQHYRGPTIEIATIGIDKKAVDDSGVSAKYKNGEGWSWLKPPKSIGQKVFLRIECIDVIRHVKDMRLANAMKYIWRVAFGGKRNDQQDIQKAIWYLNDWLENKVEGNKE